MCIRDRYAEAAGITVKNTPRASSQSVAELAMAHMFACARFVSIAGHTMREDKWEKKAYGKGIELQGKTLDELKAIKAQLTEQAAQRTALISDIKALAAELGESVDENALKGMTYDQLVAKKQELQDKKAAKDQETQRQADLAAIRALDPAAADSVQNSDAASVTSKLNEVRSIRTNLEAAARGLGIDPTQYHTNAELDQAIKDLSLIHISEPTRH